MSYAGTQDFTNIKVSEAGVNELNNALFDSVMMAKTATTTRHRSGQSGHMGGVGGIRTMKFQAL